MRPLVLLVVAEFLVLVLLASLWLGGTPAVAVLAGTPPAPAPPAADVDSVVAASARSGPAPVPLDRRDAAATVPDVAADDPLGILVSGNIRSSDGAAVESAHVNLRRDDEWHTSDSAAPGVYAVAGLRPGEWQLSCRAEGFANYETKCTLDARAFQQIDIELKPAYIVRVKMQSADGKSIIEELRKTGYGNLPNVVATAAPLAGDLPITQYGTVMGFGVGEWHPYSDNAPPSDKPGQQPGCAGELHLQQPPPAYVALLLRHVLLQSQRIEPGQHEVVFTMDVKDVFDRMGTIKLRVLDGVTGEPVAGATVLVHSGQGAGFRKVGDDGRLLLEHVSPGLISLQAFVKDHEGLWRSLRVQPGAVVDLGDLALARGIKVTGVVLDAAGKPVEGALVHCHELDSRTVPLPLFGNISLASDAEGHFTFNAGPHCYLFSANSRTGSAGCATVDANSGAPPLVTIVLAQPTKVALRANFDRTVGYTVSALTGDRMPVAVVLLGSDARQESMSLLPGAYTIEIHDMTDRLVHSFALQVGSEPLGIDVP